MIIIPEHQQECRDQMTGLLGEDLFSSDLQSNFVVLPVPGQWDQQVSRWLGPLPSNFEKRSMAPGSPST